MIKKFGIFNTELNLVTRAYDHSRKKGLDISENEIHFEMDITKPNGRDEKAYIYSSETNEVQYDESYVPFDKNELIPKIYRYVEDKSLHNLRVAPVGLDYITGLTTKLYPKRTFNKGELNLVEWYGDEEKTDLILKVEIDYTRNPLGFADYRTTTRTWYLENGEEASPKKITKKKYSDDMLGQIEEGIKRRGNLVKALQIPVLGSMLATIQIRTDENEQQRQNRVLLLGRQFLAQHKSSFTNFIEDSNKDIIGEVEGSADFWLDNVIDQNGTTIRKMIIHSLTIEDFV